MFNALFNFRVQGTENIPQTGGVIIAANHISLWDPPVIGVALSREIHFMAKEELFKNPIFGWIIRSLNAFPVRRGFADRTAIRIAMDLLEDDQVIGLFPEGTRSKTGKLGSPEPGLGMIAAKTGATIVPTAILGTNTSFFHKGCIFPKFEIRFGKPIPVRKGKTSKEDLEKLSNQIMQEIDSLLKK